MKRYFVSTLVAAVTLSIWSSPVLAAAEGGSSGGGMTFFTSVAIASVVAMAIASVGCGLAQSSAVKAAVEGIARNPGAAGKILPSLLIGLAMIESLAIYVLVIALILLFANPFIAHIVGVG